MDAETEPLPAGRASETRELILMAGINEFCANGYAGANTAAIVSAAGCNIRMLYHYFGNKHGLYRAALQRVYDELRESEDRLNFWNLPPREGMIQLTVFTFDYMWRKPQFPQMMINENISGGDTVRTLKGLRANARPLISKIDALIGQGFANGSFTIHPAAIDLYLTILALSFINHSNMHTLGATFGLDLRSDEFRDERRQHVVSVVLRYLGAAVP